jgi:hypothetical protein
MKGALPFAWTGCGYVLAGPEEGGESRSMYEATLDPWGRAISPGEPIVDGTMRWPSGGGDSQVPSEVVWTGSTIAVAWMSFTGTDSHPGFDFHLSIVGFCSR